MICLQGLQTVAHRPYMACFIMILEPFLKGYKIKVNRRESVWPEKPKILTVWLLQKKLADPLLIVIVYYQCMSGSVYTYSCNPHINLKMILSPFFKWENWNSEFVSSLNDPLKRWQKSK